MSETEWMLKQWHTGRNEMELKVIPGLTRTCSLKQKGEEMLSSVHKPHLEKET